MNKSGRRTFGLGLLVGSCCFAFLQMHRRPGEVFAAQAAAQSGMMNVKGATDASGVMYFSHQEISPAFKQAVMLYDGVPEKSYRVAVFHRDKGGEVEIHKKDTDVFYIVEGTATFVTGGTVTGGKETAPDEIRVATMDGGVERKLGKGDVIIVPVNVTHWFKDVQQPITYFGVKVR
jgi:quercetin dioxygenase-like cupin family protein